MEETEYGYPWDVSYEPEQSEPVVFIDHDVPMYLTRSDLQSMLNELEDEL